MAAPDQEPQGNKHYRVEFVSPDQEPQGNKHYRVEFVSPDQVGEIVPGVRPPDARP